MTMGDVRQCPGGGHGRASSSRLADGDLERGVLETAANTTQGKQNLSVTSAPDGTWKSTAGGSGTSWLAADRVWLEGVTGDGTPIKQGALSRSYTVNIGTGGPSSVGLNTTRTACPMRTLSTSQSTRLVIIVGPSASVT